ncbi:MAG: hypothetical protein KGJ39_02350 [Acidobacteriota bacterium]|nr:hypothetical protein [Acidobacteriota bacterium]
MSRLRVSARHLSVVAFAVSLATLSAVTVASASPLGPTNSQRRALAVLEARHLLEVVDLPSGARGVARTDLALGRFLSSSGALSADPDQVDLTRFYLVARGRWALNWLESHVPTGGTRSGWATGSGPGTPTSHTLTFSYPTPPMLVQAQLQYSMVIVPSGELGLRVDANVLWTPRKSPFSLVGGGATKIVVTMDRGLNVASQRVTTVTVTSRVTIEAIRSTLNAAPVATLGTVSCPFDGGALMTLSWWRKGATGPYAVVVADPGGCGGVTVTQLSRGGQRLGVGHDAGGGDVVRFVATTLGIRNWMGVP